MQLITSFHGDELLFEGDLPLTLRAIPAGARIRRARATLTPAVPGGAPPDDLFRETITVSGGRGDFGVLARAEGDAAIIDFGARRNVELIAGANLGARIRLHLDVGGAWLLVNQNGVPVSGNATSIVVPVGAAGLALPAISASRLRVEQTAADAALPAIEIRSVRLRTYPSNLVLRLGTLGPAWFQVGDLREPVTTPDFGPILQAYLDRSGMTEGIVEVPFVLHSDTLARLRLTLDIDYFLTRPMLDEVNEIALPFDVGAVPVSQPAQVAAALPLNARVLPSVTTAQVAGRFAPGRVFYGPLNTGPATTTARIDPQHSYAIGVELEVAHAATAIDLQVESVSATAVLLVTLQEDAGGKPWGPSLLPEPIRVALTRPAAGGVSWASAPLADAFTFAAARRYWLIVNIAEGEVDLAVDPAPDRPPLLVTRDNGLSWRSFTHDRIGGPFAGRYRLRDTPRAYRQPISLEVAGHPVSLAAYDALGKVDFRIDLPAFAAAFNDALDDAAMQRATLTERIVDGAFARWTRIERRGNRPAAYVPAPALAQLLSAGQNPARTPVLQSSPLVVVAPDASRAFSAGAVRVEAGELSRLVPQVDILVNDNQPHLAGPVVLDEDDGGMGGVPVSLALAPDGRVLYVLILRDNDGIVPVIQKVDAMRGEALERRALPRMLFQAPFHLAADPRCRYVYIASRQAPSATNNQPFPVLIRMRADSLAITGENDPLTGQPTPAPIDKLRLAPLQLAPGEETRPTALIVSADGRRAYVASHGSIQVVDLDAWRWMGRAWDDTAGHILVGLALSADGARLYAISETSDKREQLPRRELLVLDAAALDMVAAGQPFERAILRRAALPYTLAQTSRETTNAPRRVIFWLQAAVTPDNTRLLFVDLLRSRVEMVNTGTYDVLDAAIVPDLPFALAVTPESRRALVLNGRLEPDQSISAGVRVIELDSWTPVAWALSGGRVAPTCIPGVAAPSVRIGHPIEASGISQIVQVTGGQEYALRFNAVASAPGAQAELFWLNSDCGLLGRSATDIMPASCNNGTRPYTTLQPHTLRAWAPEGADRVELRFKQPFDGYTLLDDVSLAAPGTGIDNGDFSRTVAALDPATGQAIVDPVTGAPVRLPQGWRIEPSSVSPERVVAFREKNAPGVRLASPTAAPARLSQTLSVTAGEPFTLELHAFPAGRDTGAAAFELHWTGSTVPPLVVPIERQQFDRIVVEGVVPPDVTGAELAFTQQPGGILEIVAVRFGQAPVVQLPVTFLSETPGELNVIAPVVAYDIDSDARRLQPGRSEPAPAPCRPTPPDTEPLPGGSPAGEPEEAPVSVEGYCPCCETIHGLPDAVEEVAEGGMVSIRGTCPNCGVPVTIYSLRAGR